VLEAEALRDFLYTKLRGVRDGARPAAQPIESGLPGTPPDEALTLLIDIRDSLRRLEERLGGPGRPA
jgi:hypothetical protein